MKSTFRALKTDEIMLRPILVTKKVVKLICYKKPFVDEKILEDKFGFFGFDVKPLRNPVAGEPDGCQIIVRGSSEKAEKRTVFGYPNTSNCGEKNPVAVAGFRLGIGTELYTAPDISFFADEVTEIKESEDGCHCYDKFRVTEMKVKEVDGEKAIVKLSVTNLSTQITKTWIADEGVHDLAWPSQVIDERNATIKASEEIKKPVGPVQEDASPVAPPEPPEEVVSKNASPAPTESKEEPTENVVTSTEPSKVESPKQEVQKEEQPKEEKSKIKPITGNQIKTIERNMEQKNLSIESLRATYGFKGELKDLTVKQASAIIGDLIKK